VNNIFVSSAYITSFASWIFIGMSFIYTKNKKDPKIEPCGTPCAMTLGEDWTLCRVRLLPSVLDISTNYVLFIKYNLTKLLAEALTPYESI
jgi:hypothetical protein